jgi:hypothetical protein
MQHVHVSNVELTENESVLMDQLMKPSLLLWNTNQSSFEVHGSLNVVGCRHQSSTVQIWCIITELNGASLEVMVR